MSYLLLRIRDSKHFANPLRQRLKSRHRNGASREIIARMRDADAGLKNDRGKRRAAKRRAEKAASE
jgi:hypothetical protein